MLTKKKKYIGYRQADFDTTYSKFFNESVKPATQQAMAALAISPLPVGSLPPIEQVASLLEPGYMNCEQGFTLEPDGSARVAVLTQMPRVLPRMWDWWFGWHGSADDRYKLWHPLAHRSAEWQDGELGQAGYIGRVSMIEEYIGEKMERANIQFVAPTDLGLPDSSEQAVFICARLGYTHLPLDFGWLVHQVRAVEGGAEMRSRFWVGGSHIQLRATGSMTDTLTKLLRKIKRIPAQQAANLLLHCSEEMNHLAAFLPEIYMEQYR